MGGRGVRSSSGNAIRKGNYEYTKNEANLSVKVLDVKKDKILVQLAGHGPNGTFFSGNKVITTSKSELIKEMKKKG